MSVKAEIDIPKDALGIRESLKRGNSVEELYYCHQAGESLNPGALTKILHLLPEAEKESLRPRIRKAQEEYWQKWTPFRCGLVNEGQLTFDHVIRLLPVRAQFANFVDPQEGDLIVDLMGGSANMARYFARRKGIAGNVNIDGNPLIKERAEKQLQSLGIPNSHVIVSDLSDGLPLALSEIIEKTGPKRIRYVSNWGITYLDAYSLLQLVEQCFDPEFNSGISATLDFNMITNGSFDPEVLKKRFFKEIVPQNMLTCQINALRQAGRAIPQMMEFGRSFRTVAPIWYPEEIKDILETNGFKVAKTDDSLLWGQSTAIKVTGKTSPVDRK